MTPLIASAFIVFLCHGIENKAKQKFSVAQRIALKLLPMKFVKNQTTTSADVLIYDEIFSGMGSEVAREIEMLSSEVELIRVRINSPGGSVMDAYSIISAMNKSNAHVVSYIDGIAASSGALIALAGDNIFMAPFGRLMIHNPSGGDDKGLEEVRKSIIEYTAKRTGMSKEEVEEKMEEETWIGFETAKAMGIVDAEIDFEKQPAVNKDTSTTELMAIANSIVNPKDMSNIKNKLGLDSSASDETMENKVQEILDSKAEIEKENKELKEKVANAEKAEAKSVVDQAIKDGKVDPNKKDALYEQAEKDLDSFKNFLEAIPTTTRKITDDMTKTGTKQVSDKVEGKTFRDLTKENGGDKILKSLKDNDEELYNAMYENPLETAENLK